MDRLETVPSANLLWVSRLDRSVSTKIQQESSQSLDSKIFGRSLAGGKQNGWRLGLTFSLGNECRFC